MNPEQKREDLDLPEGTEEELKENIITYTDEYKDKVIKFFEEMEKEFPEVTGAPDVRNVPEWFQRDEASNFWIAAGENDEVVGTAGLRNCGKGVGYLSRLYVKKELRGKGIGSKLTTERLKFAKEKGYKKVFMATMPDNKKIHEFDIKHGFKRVDSPPTPPSFSFSKGTVFFEMDLEKGNK